MSETRRFAEPNPIRPTEHAPTRRDLLGGAGLALGCLALPAGGGSDPGAGTHKHAPAQAFDFKNEPPRRRKSFADLTDDEVRALCLAVGHMRNGSRDSPLPLSSPVQWDQYALLHAHHCTDDGAAQVHWSWFFLPWHRAYLFFLERILANILTTVFKEEGGRFALPYWDRESHKQIPNTRERAKQGKASPFFGYDASLDALSETLQFHGKAFDNMALWDGYRGPNPEAPDMKPENENGPIWKQHTQLTAFHSSPAYLRSILQFPFEIFAGGEVISRDDGQGLLEQFPHNLIHDWVGSRHGSNRDMGTLRYAALDPLFYLHHANVDRLWSLYRYTPDPDTRPTWGKQTFTFTDIDGKAVSVTVGDIVRKMANVSYAPPVEPTQDTRTLLSALPALPKGAPQAFAAPVVQTPQTIGATPLTLTVATLKPELNQLLARGDAKENPALSLLEFDVSRLEYSGRLEVRIFADKKDATVNTPITDPHFVGILSALDSHAGQRRDGETASHKFRVDVTKGLSQFYNVVRPGEPFTLTLVPAGNSADLKEFRMTVRSVMLRIYQ